MSSTEFPPSFFERADEADDAAFYALPRFVTHIDDGAIAAVGALYDELGVRGDVLDVMSSWVSHFRDAPDALTVLGMNADELAANKQARAWVVHDLNTEPVLPFGADAFDHATCCVSVDYLTRPLHVFRDIARVVRPGGLFVCTFSNRLFPTKAIRGWLHADTTTHQRIVAEYFTRAGRYEPPTIRDCRASVSVEKRPSTDASETEGDPLYGVWARVR